MPENKHGGAGRGQGRPITTPNPGRISGFFLPMPLKLKLNRICKKRKIHLTDFFAAAIEAEKD